MSIKGAGSFNGGAVAMPEMVNPFKNLSNLLLAEQKQAADEAYKNEMIGMQKQEHQMKADEQARQLAEIDNTKKFYTGLEKPAQLAASSALFSQNGNPLLQKQIEDMQYKPTDTAEETARKTKLQATLGAFGSTMATMPELQETRLQQGRRLLGEMGANAPLAGIKKLDEMHAAELAANATKAASVDKSLEHANDNWMKLQLEAMKHGNGDTITTTNGTVLPIGGSGKVLNPMKFTVDMAELQKKEHDAGYSRLASNIKSLGAGKLLDLTPEQQTMLQASYNKYTAAGYNPNEVADAVAAGLPKTPSAWQFWKDKPAEVTLSPEMLKELEPGKRATAQLLDLKTQEAQMANILTQAKNSGTSGADILKAFSPYYQGQIAKSTAEKALLGLTPEQRQAQTASSYLGKLLAPEVVKTTSKGSSAEELDAGNLVPKQKEALDTTVNYVRNKHGLNSAQAYAIATNGLSESGFDSKATGDGGTAGGYFQHRLDRQEALKKFAGEKDVNKIPLEKQLDFVVAEMAQRKPSDEFVARFKIENPGYQGFVSQLDEFKSFTSPKDAASYLSANYEVAKGNSTKEGEAARRGEIANKLFDNQPQQEATDVLSRAMAGGRSMLTDKSKIQQLFAEANTAPDAPVMLKPAQKSGPTPGYELLADAAADIGKTAKSMIMQSPVGKLFEGKSATKPVVAVLNNTAAGMLQIAGSPYTAAKLFTDWMVTGKTEDSVFDANAKQAYTTAVAALNEYGIKNPTEQQIIMLVSDMMAPGGGVKTAKGVLPKAANLSEEAVTNILKSIKNDTSSYAKSGAFSSKSPDYILRSPEALAEAEARRRKFMQGNQYDSAIGPRPPGLQ